MSDIVWDINSGLLPSEIRRILDRPFINIKGADINGWTIVHFLVGGIFRLLGFGVISANIAHLLWEIFQVAFGITDLSLSSEWYDTLFDTVAFNVGYLAFGIIFRTPELKW